MINRRDRKTTVKMTGVDSVIDNIDRLIDPTSYVFSTCYTKDATIRYRICLAEQDHLIYDVGGDLDQHEYWEQLHKHSSIIIFTVDLDNLVSLTIACWVYLSPTSSEEEEQHALTFYKGTEVT